MGFDDDIELMLTIGRALYRAAMYAECRDIFAKAAASRPDSAEAAASLGYALHRLGDDVGSGRQVRRALRLNPDLHEARIYLGHLLYDRGDWEGSLRELERVPPQEHWDPLAVWRLMELKRTLWHMESGDARLAPWEQRLQELEQLEDPIDRLLADVESRMGAGEPDNYFDPSQLELFERKGDGAEASQVIRLADGHLSAETGEKSSGRCAIRRASGTSRCRITCDDSRNVGLSRLGRRSRVPIRSLSFALRLKPDSFALEVEE